MTQLLAPVIYRAHWDSQVLSKGRFCQRTNVTYKLVYYKFWQHFARARIRKQNILKILCIVICVEDYQKLTQTQFLIQFPLGNMTSLLTKRSLAYAP